VGRGSPDYKPEMRSGIVAAGYQFTFPTNPYAELRSEFTDEEGLRGFRIIEGVTVSDGKAHIPNGRLLGTIEHRLYAATWSDLKWGRAPAAGIYESFGFGIPEFAIPACAFRIYGTSFLAVTGNLSGSEQTTLTWDDDYKDNFHLYEIRWVPDRVEYYIDNTLVATHETYLPEWPRNVCFDNRDTATSDLVVDKMYFYGLNPVAEMLASVLESVGGNKILVKQDPYTDILPQADNTYVLGSTTKRWKEIHAVDAYLSTLKQNLAADAGITVDGVDISALLLKTTKIGNLGDIWDKTTKIDHGADLTGLSDDDHTIYLLADGTRALTGNLSVGAGVTVDGIDISVHDPAKTGVHGVGSSYLAKVANSDQQIREADIVDLTSYTSYNIFKTGDAYNAIIQGTWAHELTTDQFMNGIFDNRGAAALNDEINYKFSCKAGTFTLCVLTLRYISRGIATISVDGVSQGTIDFYASDYEPNIVLTLSVTLTTDGEHTLSFKVTGKNASSTNYYIPISSWWLRS